MKKLLFLIISTFSLIISGCDMPEIQKKPEGSVLDHTWRVIGGINKEQPIPIGDEIYIDSVAMEWAGVNTPPTYYYVHTISYTYMGLEENNIKLLYKYTFNPPPGMPQNPRMETFNLTLPLNPKKQLIFKVKGFQGGLNRGNIVPKQELIITVVDEFNRITVEETGKTQKE